MRLNELLEGLDVQDPIPQDVEIQGVSYDTRTLNPGDLYVALRGSKTDGHTYIQEARAKGAAAILGEWRKAGWISTDRGRLSVLDLDCLLDLIMNSELRC